MKSFNIYSFSITLIVLFLLAGHARAQSGDNNNRNNKKTKWGIKGGLSLSNFYQDDFQNEDKIRLGFHAGIGGRKPLIGQFLAIQPELLYVNKGIHSDIALAGNSSIKQTIAMNYLEMPLMASVRILGLDFHGGVYGSFLLQGNTIHQGDAPDLGNDFRTRDFQPFDYGYVGGVSTNFGGLGLGLRYTQGMREVAKSAVAKTAFGSSKNASVQLYVSVGIK